MTHRDDDRFYLFGVLSGVDDATLKRELGRVIDYEDGIQGIHWWKPAVNDKIGGAVRLMLDKKAAELLKQNRENLTVNGKEVVFVDRNELPVKTTCTIDDNIIQLVKSKLHEQGAESMGIWDSLVGGLTMTKLHNDKEGYDYWSIQSSLSELKGLEAGIRQILLQGIDSSLAPNPASIWTKGTEPPSEKSEDESDVTEVPESEAVRFTAGKKAGDVEISQMKTWKNLWKDEAIQCNVCEERLDNGKPTVRLSSCGHLMHKGCFDLRVKKEEFCPTCRRNTFAQSVGLIEVKKP